MQSTLRRQSLISEMNKLEAKGFGCQGCSGTCCTFEANSMMTTPLETMDLFTYLKEEKLLTIEFKERLLETVRTYRLDQGLGNGRRSFVRKTYTCTFFNHKELGCPLPREVKPYGCLAFNSHHETEKAGANCFSDKKLLLERESHEEETSNTSVKLALGISWEKLPLPSALLDVWERLSSDSNSPSSA